MITLLTFATGLLLLVAGGESLVRGASRLAEGFGIAPLVVGLTVVAFGTSAPELAVSVSSVLDGRVDLALGNVVGSNLFNVLFILGLSALITPLAVDRQLIRQEVPVMVGASLLLLAFALDREIGRVDGIVLFALAVVYTVVLIVQARRSGAADSPAGSVPDDDATSPGMPSSAWSSRRSVQLLLIVTGVALLVVGARLLVAAAVTFAQTLGMSERVIGLTIVAAGTSLPEVATSVVAAFRGQRDIAIGNVVGSNIFNILCVAGLSAAVSATALPVGPSTLIVDLPLVVLVSCACLPIFFTGRRVDRLEGTLFLAAYVGYVSWAVLSVA